MVGDIYFEVTSVRMIQLEEVAEEHFKEEGFDSPEAFKVEWRLIHPYKGYQPDWMIYYHEFKRKY